MTRATARSLPQSSSGHAAIEFDLIEALFFGYRGFVAEPDRTLSARGFGRAHHRVLHFVYRNPGLTIAALLEILQITKQSLARVLKDLVDGGLVEQKEGADDRRQRLLYTTEAGLSLAFALADGQSERLRMALLAAGPGGREAVEQFLLALAEAPAIKTGY